ncbi:MAG: flagellar hook-basal body complex protein FliE [Actinomycetota bacterium]|nr:flagellar hook-basal body complex protein FliE [Actinomycetota bacterium]
MSIGPIGGFTPLSFPSAGSTSASKVSGSSFGETLTKGVEQVQKLQANSDEMAKSAATGDLTDVHDYMIASTQASLATELTVAVRNRAVDAFNEIMRMPM